MTSQAVLAIIFGLAGLAVSNPALLVAAVAVSSAQDAADATGRVPRAVWVRQGAVAGVLVLGWASFPLAGVWLGLWLGR